MFRIRKGFIKVLFALFAIVILLGGVCVYQAQRYVANVPKLTPKEKVFVVAPKESYTASDFVNVECEGEYRLSFILLETEIEAARLYGKLNDTIYVGDTKGDIRLQICGYGNRSEGGEPVEINLVVE